MSAHILGRGSHRIPSSRRQTSIGVLSRRILRIPRRLLRKIITPVTTAVDDAAMEIIILCRERDSLGRFNVCPLDSKYEWRMRCIQFELYFARFSNSKKNTFSAVTYIFYQIKCCYAPVVSTSQAATRWVYYGETTVITETATPETKILLCRQERRWGVEAIPATTKITR
ncbi:hypothetical protein Q9L58_006523 [Maublancomyces gigas]|uniref:Uncharacterized protein n=1 Tax=Discina gigas TaxID=1032678 RepID=A0ABR3GF47_9PEZI